VLKRRKPLTPVQVQVKAFQSAALLYSSEQSFVSERTARLEAEADARWRGISAASPKEAALGVLALAKLHETMPEILAKQKLLATQQRDFRKLGLQWLDLRSNLPRQLVDEEFRSIDALFGIRTHDADVVIFDEPGEPPRYAKILRSWPIVPESGAPGPIGVDLNAIVTRLAEIMGVPNAAD